MTNYPSPSITVNVDVTNPGQFFACCGLLELADRLWPGAEGWFNTNGQEFHVLCEGELSKLIDQLGQSKLDSTLGDDGLKRLGTLLSAEKSKLSDHDRTDKERLSAMWKVERVHLSSPFDLWIDWWWDERSDATLLKTWAAKQLVIEIARPMLRAIRSLDWQLDEQRDCLNRTTKLSGPPFYFDAANNTQTTAQDYGFSTFGARISSDATDRPLLELLCFVGLQRFRPYRPLGSQDIKYSTWTVPLPIVVAPAAATGQLHLPHVSWFRFRMLYRTKYMKAFLPAQLQRRPNNV
jgi:CRISPR-associated protein Csb3